MLKKALLGTVLVLGLVSLANADAAKKSPRKPAEAAGVELSPEKSEELFRKILDSDESLADRCGHGCSFAVTCANDHFSTPHFKCTVK